MIFNNNNVEGWAKTFLGHVGEGEGDMMEESVEEFAERPAEKTGRWKSVVETSGKEPLATVEKGRAEIEEDEEDVDGMPMEEEDLDGEPMEEEDVDGVSLEDEDVDGVPMEDMDVDGLSMEEPPQPPHLMSQERASQREPTRESDDPRAEPVNGSEAPRPQKRQRMKAADMFTDS